MSQMENLKQIEELKSNLRDRKYEDVEKVWRTLSGEARLELMRFCYKSGIDNFISDKHFDFWWTDRGLLLGTDNIVSDIEYGGIIKEYGEIFNLSDGQLEFVRNGFRGERYDYEGRESVKDVALYTRLFDYKELVEKFDFLSYELLGKHPRIFKCDPRRTESRIKFLKEQGKINLIQIFDGSYSVENEEAFMEDLFSKKEMFNLKYQKELEKKLEEMSREGDYQALVSMIRDDAPGSAYDSFLELALRAIYGDKKLLKDINERKELLEKIRQLNENQVRINAQNKENSEPEKPREIKYVMTELPGGRVGCVAIDVETGLPIEMPELSININLENNSEVSELFWVVYPSDGGRKPSSKTPTVGGTGKERKALDKEANERYLEELEKLGITCEGYFASSEGQPAAGEDMVYHYILKREEEGVSSKGQYVICEAIGQEGNATYIIKVREEEDLRELLQRNKMAELVELDRAVRVYHTSDNCSPMRIKNLFQLVDEGIKDVRNTWSREKLQKEITELVPASEIPDAVKYVTEVSGKLEGITEFTKRTAKNIKEKIKKVEQNDINASNGGNSGESVSEKDSEEVEI